MGLRPEIQDPKKPIPNPLTVYMEYKDIYFLDFRLFSQTGQLVMW